MTDSAQYRKDAAEQFLQLVMAGRMADFLNNTHKYVVSSTLDKLECGPARFARVVARQGC